MANQTDVVSAYAQLFGRAPDALGLAYWTAQAPNMSQAQLQSSMLANAGALDLAAHASIVARAAIPAAPQGYVTPVTRTIPQTVALINASPAAPAAPIVATASAAPIVATASATPIVATASATPAVAAASVAPIALTNNIGLLLAAGAAYLIFVK